MGNYIYSKSENVFFINEKIYKKLKFRINLFIIKTNMNQNEISALTIGLVIMGFVSLFVSILGYYGKDFFTKNRNFYIKKWMYILFVIAINTAGCVLIYYTQNLQVMIYIILALKSKDLISSIIFGINMLYKSIFCKHLYIIPKLKLTDSINRIVAFVPIYKETLEQLSKTVDSILNNNLTPNYILVCIVSDGTKNMVDIMDQLILSERVLHYKSWKNDSVYVNIYLGTRKDKHILLIEKERNHGKKDSIILANNIFNKYNSEKSDSVNELKNEVLVNLLNVFGVNEFDYIFTTDADTVIDKNTIICLIDSVNKRNATASCGIVNVDKSNGNWFWNNLQNFQYLYGQYLRRTTEDLCNQVLCLPGCISLFKLNSNTSKALDLYLEIPEDDNLIKSNVQYVGTDRRYTSSLLYTNSINKIVMDLRCNAFTVPPQSFKSYLAQRRRWCQNMYFNNMINIIAPNINFMLRFFSVVDYLRLTLVYFRLFNTAYFIYLLSISFHLHNIIELIPYLVVLIYPVLFFFVYCIFNKFLRTQILSLFISYVFNKIFIIFVNTIIFSMMLINIGCESWREIKGNV